ncbi:MAG: SGNH/GDSL hydrolase family protein [Desulfobacterales bacterium]|nr:SGNH/GDSL hydrolase family protein [Desulfobacterales bacterium]
MLEPSPPPENRRRHWWLRATGATPLSKARSPARRRWWIPLAATGLGLLVGLLVAELALRLIGLDYRSPYVFDEHSGAGLLPGFRYTQIQEGRASIRINSAGFRDREHTLQKPAGVFRIAVLGDSFAEALQVEESQTFWSVLERELQPCPVLAGKTIEVLNFGVSGFGTAQELELLRSRVWAYQPDLVLLAFLPGNDVRNNSLTLEPDRRRPFFRLVGDRLERDRSFLNDPEVVRMRTSTSVWLKDVLRRNSLLMALVYHARHRQPAAPAAAQNTEVGLDDRVFAPPLDDDWREAWRVAEGILSLMVTEVRQHDAKLVIAVLNNAVQVPPDPAATQEMAERLHVGDIDEPDRRLQQFGERTGVPVILLTPPMREIARREKVYFHGFPNTAPGTGHWNKLGHQTAGEILARELCPQLSP